MSINLTTLSDTDRFKKQVSKLEKPSFDISSLTVEPNKKNGSYPYSLVGTAFDYLLRFHIERLNQETPIYKSDSLIADHAVQLLESPTDPRRPLTDSEYTHYQTAKETYQTYVSEPDTDHSPPTHATLVFGKLDPIVRTSRVHPDDFDLNIEEPRLQDDLEQLLYLSEELWTVDDYAVLNPTLGTQFVTADADLILDDTLIDIKTTVKPRFTGEQWRQLIGYLILLDIHSGTTRDGWEISLPDSAGIYFSRSGDLKTFDTDRLYESEHYQDIKQVVLDEQDYDEDIYWWEE